MVQNLYLQLFFCVLHFYQIYLAILQNTQPLNDLFPWLLIVFASRHTEVLLISETSICVGSSLFPIPLAEIIFTFFSQAVTIKDKCQLLLMLQLYMNLPLHSQTLRQQHFLIFLCYLFQLILGFTIVGFSFSAPTVPHFSHLYTPPTMFSSGFYNVSFF